MHQVPVSEQELKGKSKKKDNERVEREDRRRDDTIDSQGEGKVSDFKDIFTYFAKNVHICKCSL